MIFQWTRLCNTYLQEAKWYHEGYKPNLTEYLHHAVVSISAHLMLLDSYLFTTPSISEEAIDYINNLPNLLHCGATVIRLSNDLATSSVISMLLHCLIYMYIHSSQSFDSC